MIFPPSPSPGGAGRWQQRPASGSLGHIQPRQVLCARLIPANLKIDVLFSLLLTGQPCTVKTRRRLDWEFWLYVLCKPKYGTHRPCSAGAHHPYQWVIRSWAINERQLCSDIETSLLLRFTDIYFHRWVVNPDFQEMNIHSAGRTKPTDRTSKVLSNISPFTQTEHVQKSTKSNFCGEKNPKWK